MEVYRDVLCVCIGRVVLEKYGCYFVLFTSDQENQALLTFTEAEPGIICLDVLLPKLMFGFQSQASLPLFLFFPHNNVPTTGFPVMLEHNNLSRCFCRSDRTAGLVLWFENTCCLSLFICSDVRKTTGWMWRLGTFSVWLRVKNEGLWDCVVVFSCIG